METIKGYDYGKATLEQSPVTMQDLALLKKTLLWSDEDDRFLNMTGEVLKDQTNDVLELWYGYVGGNDHLLHYFTKNGQPNMDYLGAVRKRFGQWILDLCHRPYDQDWLNYQHEIALRHHSTKKNHTDGVEAVTLIHPNGQLAIEGLAASPILAESQPARACLPASMTFTRRLMTLCAWVPTATDL